MQNQGKIIIFFLDFKSMTSMHVQTAEEVGDVCKLLSSVTKYSGKYIYIVVQLLTVAALRYFKTPSQGDRH